MIHRSPSSARRGLLAALPGLALLLGLGAARPAQAQVLPRSVELDIHAGYYSFMSRGGFSADETVKLENLNDGLNLGGRFGVNFTSFIAYEATFEVLRTSTDDTFRRAWVINNHHDLVLSLPFPFVSPYFAIGAGFQHYNVRPLYAKGLGAATDAVVRDPYHDPEARPQDVPYSYRSADGDFLFDVGGGAKFILVENADPRLGFQAGLRLDARYKATFGPATFQDGVPTLEPLNDDGRPNYTGNFHHLELGGGIWVAFGGGIGPDKDRDGVPNRQDKCVDDAEDKDDFQDEDGCPDLDDDGDGVPDEDDACRLVAEDVDGFEDKDGCPDDDNDGDGILDKDDRCRDKAEDADGFEDMDGCPELDNDADGFMDTEDACTNAMETWNSYLDQDGCPDEVPADLAEFAGAIPAIQFKLDSATLLPKSKPVLDKAARALNRYPDLGVEIQGHASSDGDDEHNLRLSQDRTEAVREYLISRGVDPDRLRARGYGETQPVATNDTEEGRGQNRRVEFKLYRMD
mgnify:CR=1 FL=1